MTAGYTEVPARRAEEFWCATNGGGCGKYFKTFLRRNMNGKFRIICPACGHKHYRIITDGLVTGDRHYERDDNWIGEDVPILGSTLRDTPWHDDPTYQRQQLRLYNGGASP